MADLNLFFFTVKERIGILFCAADFLVYLTSKWTLFNYLKKTQQLQKQLVQWLTLLPHRNKVLGLHVLVGSGVG